MNMVVLQPTRTKPKAGDLFVCNLRGERWVAGRVVHLGCMMVSDRPGYEALLYFYRIDVPAVDTLRPPIKPNLLIPPIGAGFHGWRDGFFKTIWHAPLSAGERLARHVFVDSNFASAPDEPNARFVNEYRQPCERPGPNELWERSGAYLPKGIDDLLSDALGIRRAPEESPGKGGPGAGDRECIVYVPDADGSMDLLDLEAQLEVALLDAGAGEWEGHGYDVERRCWDIRFNGPDPGKIGRVLLPMLKSLTLPSGSFLIIGGDEPKRVDL
ncbi:MAG: hypothetical protein IPJ41_17025 [Phycisphaerales bacterium]|nr:hypothetical protein [Phycisphaerales bacterium]